MSVISRRSVAVAPRRHQTSVDLSAPLRRIATGVLLSAAVISIVTILGAAALLTYGRIAHADTIYSGTSSGGVDLGGMTVAEAEAALDARFKTFYDRPIPITFEDTTLNPTPAELGVTFNVRATAEHAYAFGREDSIWEESHRWLDALAGGTTVEPIVSIDRDAFAAYMDAHASTLARGPRDARFVRGQDGGITIDPGSSGVSIDVGATYQRFQQRVATMSNEPIEIETIVVEATTTDPDLQPILDEVQTLAGDPFQLSLDGTIWEISASDLLLMVSVEESDDYDLTFDEAAFGRYIRALESSIFRPGENASISIASGTIETRPAVPGRKLDAAASIERAIEALRSGEDQVTLVTTPVQPNITDDEVAAAKAEAERLASRSLTLTWDGGTGTLDAAKLAKALRVDVNPDRNPAFRFSFDEEEMGKALALIAREVKVEGKDADLRWINGTVSVKTPESMGRELDVAATADRIRAAIEDGSESVAIVTRDLKPPVTAEMAGAIQIRDKLSESWTEYGSSVPNRLHNVELAAQRANGALVAPGATYSFNASVGAVTFDNGYRTGYGIVGASNGEISTIPSVGGGICQVATTVFQAAFRAGMPIVERNWHLYWIPRYGQPPTGMKGLDATVDDAYGLDFKFKNTTNDWLAIKSWTDGSYLHFELWGINPGWQIAIDQPTITNYRPANHQMVYEESDQLPAGQSVFVEHAEDGFDASIHRVVRKDGQIIDEVTLVSSYAPARNVTLVGTGG